MGGTRVVRPVAPRGRGALSGAFAGLVLAALETGVRYLPAVAGTDLRPELGLPLLAGLVYGGAGALLGALHPRLGPLAPLGFAALAAGSAWHAWALPLAATAAGAVGLRRPRLVGAVSAALLVAAALLPRSETAPAGSPTRPDVVLVVMDTVGAASTSLHGAALRTTPVLERLAREGVWFRRAVATAPWTVPSHASLLTGEHPRVLGCHHEHPALPDGVPTTAEILARAGYRTGAFLANPWVGRFNGLTRGFEHSESLWELQRKAQAFSAVRALGRLRESEPAKGGSLLVQHALDWLDRAGTTPSFVLLNLLEAHSPFHQVAAATRFGVDDPVRVGERTHRVQMHGPHAVDDYPRPGEIEAARRLHAAAIHHADAVVGELLAGLAARGRLDRTLLVVTSDHGEAFGEHGFHGHMVGLHSQTLHVPLVLRHPSLPARRSVDAVVSLRSVHPTLVAFATGRPMPGSLLEALETGDGRPSLAVSEQRRPLQVLSDFRREGERPDLAHLDGRALRVRRGDLVLLRETPTGGEPRYAFYDLAEDPSETRNLWPDPRAEELLPLLDAHAARPVVGAQEAGALDALPTDLRAQLEALGYLGG